MFSRVSVGRSSSRRGLKGKIFVSLFMLNPQYRRYLAKMSPNKGNLWSLAEIKFASHSLSYILFTTDLTKFYRKQAWLLKKLL
jgi:hypothetical protein